jgi:hypothetical protein
MASKVGSKGKATAKKSAAAKAEKKVAKKSAKNLASKNLAKAPAAKKPAAASKKRTSSAVPKQKTAKATAVDKSKAKQLEAKQVKGKAEIKIEKKLSKAETAKAEKLAKGQEAKPELTPAERNAEAKTAKAAAKATALVAARANHCREAGCEQTSTTGSYCRLHYIKNWKKIKRKELILKEKRLDVYIEELVTKYPERYIEAIRQDLASDKDFAKVISELEIEEFSADNFDADADSGVEDIIESSGAAPAKRAPDYDDDEDFNY